MIIFIVTGNNNRRHTIIIYNSVWKSGALTFVYRHTGISVYDTELNNKHSSENG
jgi:hypothetical protein